MAEQAAPCKSCCANKKNLEELDSKGWDMMSVQRYKRTTMRPV